MVGSVTFPAEALPNGAVVVRTTEQPTAEIPFESGTVIVNPGTEPLYLVGRLPHKYEAERSASGVPVEFSPHFKLASGRVHEWRQDSSSAPVGTDPRTGSPIYGWHWVPMSAGFVLRSTPEGDGVLLLPGRFPYLSESGPPVDPFDCSGGVPASREVELAVYFTGAPLTIPGTLTFVARDAAGS